ncbi:IS600 ORF2 [Shigella flexneri 2a]|nr:IS600 ORF2 [Shigella flexneri 2a]
MCQVFGVSRSGYYNWVQHEPSDRKQSDERLKLEIKVAHIRTRETYGTRRLQTELAENGIIVGRDRLARLRKELRLRCKQKRKFRATTNPNHNLPVAPNLLNQTFAPTAPNQVWVADLTYVATQEGWLYLAGIKDVYTCEIVGYAMGERMTKELTGKALFMALRSQRPPAGLIHHSDRGSQYCAYDYRVIQEQSGLKTSMSRKGNCYDNAPMESFWGTLKNESLSHYRQQCGVNRVWRLMKRVGIKAQVGYRSPRARKGEASIVSPNRLQRQFNPDAPDERWVTDITYIRPHEGWLYLAVVVDLFSRKIIGWSMQSRMTKDIVLNALLMAVWRRNPEKQVLVHSDQGSQYTSHEWQSFLKSHGLEG